MHAWKHSWFRLKSSMAWKFNSRRQEHTYLPTFTYTYLNLHLPLLIPTFVYTYLCLHLPLLTPTFTYTYLFLYLPLLTPTFTYTYLYLYLPLLTLTITYVHCTLPNKGRSHKGKC